MATHPTLVANPTAADVTVNAKTAVKGAVTLLSIDDAVITEYNGFLAAGCVLQRETVGTEDQRINAGYLLYTGQHIA